MTKFKSGLTPQLSSITKKVAWFNIFIQLAFPISATLPANVFAEENSQEKQTINLVQKTNSYQVQKDDTPESIAKKFNIKLFRLIEANPNYVSLVGKLKIKEGITLNIPNEPLSTKRWLNNNQDSTIPTTNEQELAQIIVAHSSLLNKETDATQYAISQISSKANQQIEQWLNQFGHARVSLSTDKKFTLEGSSADLLIPLYDSEKNLVFSQTSYHRKDSRSQLNQGIGYRHFTDQFMVGLNAFYDYDLSRYHSRFGIGAEVWRDYFKLSANHYHRLSNWRTSDDVMDYNERPANGWDIRTEGYLPAYPQLGAKLIFEQYYGKEVGLFGKDNRQENPHAYTAGLTYTPVPLITFGAERRFGLNDNSDNKFDVNIQYRLGESLSSQLNPDNVRAMRLMSGNRYDFVNRNNDIVLEYKKKTLVFLSITPTINGYAKEEKDLGVQVRSKYPVKQIEWSASRLIANGGKINHNNNLSYSIILPRHISGSPEKNSYTISAVAIDEQGNRSDPVQSKIIVDQSAINTQNSQFTPKATQLPADNHSAQNLTLSILDNDKLPVDIDIKELSLDIQSDDPTGNSRVSSFSRIDAGKYQVTITAGSTPEIVTLTPKFRDNTFNQAQVTFVADTHSAIIAKGGLTVIKNHAPADGKSQNKIQVIVTDINANRIPNYPVSFAADNGATIIAQANTNAEGKIIVPITNTHIGKSIINVSVKDITYSTNVDFIADINSAKINTFTINPNSSFANGTDEKFIALNIIDKNNNPVPNAKIQLSADNQAQLKETELLTDVQGNASTTMTSKIAGTVTVIAQVNNIATQKTTQFIADLSNGKIISVTPSAPPYIADGKTTVTFTAVVEDKNHNILPNAKVIWSTNRDQQIVSINEVSTTDNHGIAQTTVTSTQAFDVIVTASISNESLDASPITFTANNQQGLITLTTNKTELIANNKEQAILTAVVKDKFGNKLPNVTVEWQSSVSTTLDKQKSVTDNQGQTTNQIRTQKAGATEIIATLSNKEKAQVTLTAIADPNSANIVLTTVNNKTEAVADNSDTITLMAHVTDAKNNPLIKQSVFWNSTHNVLSENMVKTDDNGNVQVVIKGTEAQPTTVTATLENSQSATQNLCFIAGQVNASQSTFSIDPQSIVANGSSFATGTITLKDKFGNLVPKQEKFIALSGDNTTIKFSALKEIDTGVYQTTINGRQEGISLISAQYANATNTFNLTQPLGFIADKQNAIINAVNVIAPFDVTANGTDQVIIRAKIVDKQGNPSMEGIAVGWLTSLGRLSLPISKTDKNGIAEITLSSTQAGTAQVTAMLDSQQSLDADHLIYFNTDVVSADKSQLSLIPNTIISETGRSQITLTLKDKYDNLLTGLKDKISVTYSADLTATTTTFNEISTGVYQAQVSALKAGQTTISAKINSVTLTQTALLTVLPNSQTAKVDKFVISDTQPHAGDTITYHAYISDKNDNPVNSGVSVTWTADKESLLNRPLTFTDNKGVADVELTRNPAGIAKVNAVLISGSYPAPDVNFVADDVDENSSEINLIPATIIANGTDKALLTLTIKDKGGNILPDQQVEGISNNPTIQFSPAKQVSPGHYEIEATGTKSGTAQLSVKVNSVDFKKQKTLQLRADATTWQVKSVDVDRTTMIAGDKGVNYQATIVDANDNILPNVIVSWKLQGLADDYDFSTYTDTNGVARTKVTSTVAGILKMSAYLDLNNHKPIQDVTVTPADIDANKSTFSSNRQSIGGDDKDSALLTVNLMDKYSNTIDGKTVSVKATSGRANFSDNPLNSLGKGKYQTSLTSNIKTDIIVTAEAEGITIAKPLTIKVTIPKPDIIFDKQIQQETYASAPVNALGYTGLPNNINVMWSSSDPTIASIDTTSGSISMKKAGTAIITLQTSGNDQYQPAQSSYPLVIEKAAPILQLASSGAITSVWNDGITHKVDATFGNTDVKNIPLYYVSDDQRIAIVDTQGTITEVKPGKTKIHIKSDATDQFLADAVTVDYEQDKGTLQITFAKNDIILSETDTNIDVQQPTTPLPKEAQGIWSAKDPNIVAIKESGVIVKVNPGRTDIILTSKENDYFYQSQGSYSVDVRKVPHITMNSVTRRVDNEKNAQITPNANTPINWTPVYDKDSLTFSWLPPDTSASDYAVNLELWDGNQKTSQIFAYDRTQLIGGQAQKTEFKIDKTLFTSTQLKIKVIVFDLLDHDPNTNTGRQYAVYYPLDVKHIDPMYMDLELSGSISFITTRDASVSRNSCRATQLDDMVHVIARPMFTLGNSTNHFLTPITVSHKLIDIKGASSRSTVDYQDENNYDSTVYNEELQSNSHTMAMKEDCWSTGAGSSAHRGNATLITYVTIAGETHEFQQHVNWDGDGGASLNNIEKISQL
ncbi:Ig-like domain-containing protein [Proteus terrae]|uniref:Ig-like domain-containing protein n=1 Tax=Proteus terrae TaxID=1574161 RepID=UPI00298C0C6A|nr:Ig-like domain-containing protein [Proteus terrae]WPC99687.1 Ig-like domain-containing protein [Proteus terrae]